MREQPKRAATCFTKLLKLLNVEVGSYAFKICDYVMLQLFPALQLLPNVLYELKNYFVFASNTQMCRKSMSIFDNIHLKYSLLNGTPGLAP